MTPIEDNSILEAIFELRWEFSELTKTKAIQNYYITIGRMYDVLKQEYCFYEPLQSASVPYEVAGYLIQHRFRTGKEEWPLIQIGPKIMTVNDTKKYRWEDFEPRVCKAYETLRKIYPSQEYELKINNLILRYINAINFDFERYTTLSFLKKEMKTSINFDPKLFEITNVGKTPLKFDCRFSFPSSEPEGSINFRFYRGKIDKADALIWETFVKSELDDIPMPLNAKQWLNNAHDLAKKWYKTLKGTSIGI